MVTQQTSLTCINNLYFKCEYENPTGSVKDRSIIYQVSQLKQKKIKNAVISSSGNAAISAAKYCQHAHIALTVFVSPHICSAKLEVLKKMSCTIVSSLKPISNAVKFAQEHNAYNMRQSKDELAPIGYGIIAHEIYCQLPIVDAVFIPVSSGTSFVGIARGFRKLGKLPALHAVQTEAIHPVAEKFDTEFHKKEKSLADGIVARFTPRNEEIVAWINISNGSGWVISDEEAARAHTWLEEHNIHCSYEGALTLAALWKAKKKGSVYENPVCLLTGKYYVC